MSSPTSPTDGSYESWQAQLHHHCRTAKMQPPVFNILSDRRGGRTAWSSTVTVQGQNIAARYWYDGQFINNAKEDAAEVALRHLRSPALTQHQAYSPSPSSFQGQGGYGHGYAAR